MFPDSSDSPVDISHAEWPVKLGLVIENRHDFSSKVNLSLVEWEWTNGERSREVGETVAYG